MVLSNWFINLYGWDNYLCNFSVDALNQFHIKTEGSARRLKSRNELSSYPVTTWWYEFLAIFGLALNVRIQATSHPKSRLFPKPRNLLALSSRPVPNVGWVSRGSLLQPGLPVWTDLFSAAFQSPLHRAGYSSVQLVLSNIGYQPQPSGNGISASCCWKPAHGSGSDV